MKHQKGAALIVVLSLLTISLMVGLSSMQSSQIDERLAGNYKAQSVAQMGAEDAASAGFEAAKEAGKFAGTSLDDLGGITWGEFNNNGNFDDEEAKEGGCDKVNCYYRHVNLDDKYYIVAMGGIDEGAVSVSEPVVIELDYDGGLIPTPEAALTCTGFSCGFFAKNPPTVISGKDYSEDVDTKGSISDGDINPDGFSGSECNADSGCYERAAYIVPDGSVDTGKADVQGETVTDRSGYEDVGFNPDGIQWDSEGGPESKLKGDIENLITLGANGDERITYWDESSSGEFSMPSSGIVVINGVNISMDVPGNFKFTGLIVVKDAAFNIRPAQGAGTVAVVGAIIAENANVDMQNGNPALLFSSEALASVGAIASPSGSGAGGDFSISEWK
ncbi:pilus assembly PilX N-terminal domain-containing protein [Halomonas sp. ATCH28]|uniref:Pilus assembly PilX N-terminal domain-containing protein n=1 Tax=Halomonas gemina TaxID=2945105 RepID=A0ABT0T557_9GAMM|nr:pilus assembly PilX N-terminal domain-containing protein [Halomonas gemina]MCL7942055.1 pilus assembly PilX N-terminal domain-containing protein [Halomonas gemina]